jgi:hypothetical protein
MKNKEIDNRVDQVTNQIRTEPVDAATVSAAAERVWARVSVETSAETPAQQAADRIGGCADFQSLIPAYLNGELSEARSMLLVDHTHECIPCRRAMKQAREFRTGIVRPARQTQKMFGYKLNPVVMRWGIAAVIVIGLGLVALPLVQRFMFGSFEVTVQAAEGPVYAVADAQMRALNSGEKVHGGDKIRTSKDARAVVRLSDGSTIEMKDRSEFSVSQGFSGTTIHLNRGSVIVEAARQKNHLFVDTGDALVTVTGTTFSVNAGTKGSRISVISGEVQLNRSGTQSVLHAGEQATTTEAIETIPVKEEVNWSRNAARYNQVLALASLQKDLNALPKPDERHSTNLLDMMPANTVLYAALPNLSTAIAESHRIIDERIQQNPALRDWFQHAHDQRGPEMNEAISAIKDFGDQLGDEIAVGAGMDDQGSPVGPIVLAELKNPAGFHAFFDNEVRKLGGAPKNGPQIQWIDDPGKAETATTTTKESGKQIYVWIDGNVLVAATKIEQLRTVANNGSSAPFRATPFYDRIAGVYRDGAGVVVAADLETIIAHTKGLRKIALGGDKHEQALSQLGVFNMKSFVLDQKDKDGKTNTRAVLSFNQADHGITSWLAPPAPMGSLEYISPDANVVAGFVVKDPKALVDDLLGVLNTVSPELQNHLNKLQTDHGLDVRQDFAAPLGGEYAFAIDGPILPTPSWKLIFEVNDPAHLQQTFERVVTEVNKQLAKEGKGGLSWDRVEASGHTFYSLRSKDFGVEVNYVIDNGYLIAGPTRALVEQALSYRASGATLAHSPKFTAGLPPDGNANFSALVYHNLAPLVQPFAGTISGTAKAMPQEQQNALRAQLLNLQPTLFYAYAFNDRIEFASNTEGGPFGLSPASLLGMPNAFQLQHILQQGMGNDQKPKTK